MLFLSVATCIIPAEVVVIVLKVNKKLIVDICFKSVNFILQI